MASDKAVMLAHAVLDNVRESNLEISGSGNVKMAATIIDAALTEARLEGSRAMKKAALSKAPVQNYPTVNASIRALDPQQVINEGVK